MNIQFKLLDKYLHIDARIIISNNKNICFGDGDDKCLQSLCLAMSHASITSYTSNANAIFRCFFACLLLSKPLFFAMLVFLRKIWIQRDFVWWNTKKKVKSEEDPLSCVDSNVQFAWKINRHTLAYTNYALSRSLNFNNLILVSSVQIADSPLNGKWKRYLSEMIFQ